MRNARHDEDGPEEFGSVIVIGRYGDRWDVAAVGLDARAAFNMGADSRHDEIPDPSKIPGARAEFVAGWKSNRPVSSEGGAS